jgi:hypothetical protein
LIEFRWVRRRETNNRFAYFHDGGGDRQRRNEFYFTTLLRFWVRAADSQLFLRGRLEHFVEDDPEDQRADDEQENPDEDADALPNYFFPPVTAVLGFVGDDAHSSTAVVTHCVTSGAMPSFEGVALRLSSRRKSTPR